jgi:transcriptional regulator with XRE-family HTH domain
LARSRLWRVASFVVAMDYESRRMSLDVKSIHTCAPRRTLLDMRASDVGPRIRELREARDLSLARLGGMAGVDPTQLSRVELGKAEPSITWIEKVAAALGVGFVLEFVEVAPRQRVGQGHEGLAHSVPIVEFGKPTAPLELPSAEAQRPAKKARKS